jgi:hypothetical protein
MKPVISKVKKLHGAYKGRTVSAAKDKLLKSKVTSFDGDKVRWSVSKQDLKDYMVAKNEHEKLKRAAALVKGAVAGAAVTAGGVAVSKRRTESEQRWDDIINQLTEGKITVAKRAVKPFVSKMKGYTPSAKDKAKAVAAEMEKAGRAGSKERVAIVRSVAKKKGKKGGVLRRLGIVDDIAAVLDDLALVEEGKLFGKPRGEVIKRPGAFTAKAKAANMGVTAFAEKVKANPGQYDALTMKQANLALTFQKMRSRKKLQAAQTN